MQFIATSNRVFALCARRAVCSNASSETLSSLFLPRGWEEQELNRIIPSKHTPTYIFIDASSTPATNNALETKLNSTKKAGHQAILSSIP